MGLFSFFKPKTSRSVRRWRRSTGTTTPYLKRTFREGRKRWRNRKK